jgi:hypothetical protein
LGHRWAAARKWETPAQILSYQRRRRARACHRQKKLRKEGEKAQLIPDGLRIEALDCRDRLKPYNASLKDAVTFFVSDHEARKRSCSVQAATGEYLKLQKLNHRSERHIGDLKYRLGVFNATFGPRLISELSVHEVEKAFCGVRSAEAFALKLVRCRYNEGVRSSCS